MKQSLVILLGIVVSVCLTLGQVCVPTPTATPTPTPTPDGGNGGGIVGDANNGATVYSDNGCGACHASDGSGGLGPDIRNVTSATLDSHLRGQESHTPKFTGLTDQEIADLEAFLAS